MPSFPFARASGDSLRVDFFLGWSKLKLLSGLRRPSHQQRETTGDCGGGGGGGPSVFIARRRGDRLELLRTEPAHWPTTHTLVGEARGRNRVRTFFLGGARFFFFFCDLARSFPERPGEDGEVEPRPPVHRMR